MSIKSFNNDSPLQVVHLAQLHKDPEFGYYELPKEISESIVKSQFNIVKYLLQNFGFPIVLESQTSDIDYHNLDPMNKAVKQIAQGVFSEGLPNSFEALNPAQKNFLYEVGGARTLIYLGILPKAFQSINQEALNIVHLKATQDHTPLSFMEETALEYANRAASLYYSNSEYVGRVILVFGAFHDFTEECQKYNFELTQVDTTEGFLHKLPQLLEENYGYKDEYL